MVELKNLVKQLDKMLSISKFKDYCPNGLQVEGSAEINKLVTGVTASEALIRATVECKADALLVHHGFFWRGETEAISGMKKRRIKLLLEHDINLLAYHLPLDAHSELGNNAQLGALLGFEIDEPLNREGIGLIGRLSQPMSVTALAAHIDSCLDRKPQLVTDNEEDMIETIAWCTGGAQSYIHQAVDAGVDAYLSGEISESTVHAAIETGVHYFAAGHHATERYGVKALGEWAAAEYGLQHEHIDLWNPV